MLALVLYVPSIREIFRFSLLHPQDILICILVSLLSAFFSESILAMKMMKPGKLS
jgi:hypothetical protein